MSLISLRIHKRHQLNLRPDYRKKESSAIWALSRYLTGLSQEDPGYAIGAPPATMVVPSLLPEGEGLAAVIFSSQISRQ